MDGLTRLRRRQTEIRRELFGDEIVNDQFREFREVHFGFTDFCRSVNIFFDENQRLFRSITNIIEQQYVMFDKLRRRLLELKSSVVSIGAEKMKKAIDQTLSYCSQQDIGGCLQGVQHIKREFYDLKFKLEKLMEIDQQIILAGGTVD